MKRDRSRKSPPTWQISWPIPEREVAAHRATICTCANGYLATRGTQPERDDGLPATALAGVYADDQYGFKTLVNVGHWLTIELYARGRRFVPAGPDSGRQTLDLRTMTVARTAVWQPPGTGQLEVRTAHFASLATPHAALQRYELRARGAPRRLRVVARVTSRAPTRGEYLLEPLGSIATPEGVTLIGRTRSGERTVAQHAMVRVRPGRRLRIRHTACEACWRMDVQLRPGRALVVEKFVAFATDRDGPDPAATARSAAEQVAARGFDGEHRRHAAAWSRVWRDADLRIEGDDALATALHFTTAQLLAHAPKTDDRAGLAAKPLSAEGYRGHVFWDMDLFMAPAIAALRPEWGRRLVDYRWEMLDGARRNAARWGHRGAWFPWESADDGREATPQFWVRHDGRHMPITCWKYEIHSVCDVAYHAWDYYRTTGDRDWLFARGVELLLETARFWASRATWVARRQRYEIRDVCGPDEVHEHVDNSAYVNTLARWNVEHALRSLRMLRAARAADYDRLARRLGLGAAELRSLRRFAQRLLVPCDPRTGWYRQFDGFEQRAFIDPQTALERYADPLDAERTQIVKQADVVMLLYLLRERHPRAAMLANWDYYVPRTQHNTSLSAGTHAAVAARLGFPQLALRYFREAVQMDLRNERGDSGRGLHGAALGGAICAVLFGFGGLFFHEDRLAVDPVLPPGWTRLALPFMYQGRRLMLDARRGGFELRFRAPGNPLRVEVRGRVHRLRWGHVLRGPLGPA